MEGWVHRLLHNGTVHHKRVPKLLRQPIKLTHRRGKSEVFIRRESSRERRKIHLCSRAMEQTEVVKPETLDELIAVLHKIFESDCVNVEEVQNIMESYESKPHEWMKYAKFDQYRYTRNLVNEGNGKFNLMILCWGEGHGSSIHDHTNSHCFLKLLQGQLKETLFDWPDRKSHGDMVQKSERILQENQVAYINDSIGLHRVENVSHTECAVSLHLYSPPFETCQTFDQRTGHKNTVKMTFWSKYGERTPFTTISQENN